MFRICSKIRLYPTPAQETKMLQTLDTCRAVYNSLLHWRKYAWETEQKSVSRYEQQAALPVWKKQVTDDGSFKHPELKEVFSQVLQDVVHRMDLAFSAFFRRVEAGEKPGYPRFKGSGHYDSFSYTQLGFAVGEDNLILSKIGTVKAFVHRQVEGELKTCTIRRQAGKWYACLGYEIQAQPLPENQEAVGIDVGIEKFAALSDGTYIENPRFFRQEEKTLAKAQRKVERLRKERSRLQKSRLRRARRTVSRIHERIRNRRHNFLHQNARKLVNRYGVLCVETLNIQNLTRRPQPKQDEQTGAYLTNGASQKAGLNKSIVDAAWNFFRTLLAEKAARASRQVVEVPPAYTSQQCSQCGNKVKKTLSQRVHYCSQCGLRLDRDTNAAINILAVGLHSVPVATG